MMDWRKKEDKPTELEGEMWNDIQMLFYFIQSDWQWSQEQVIKEQVGGNASNSPDWGI